MDDTGKSILCQVAMKESGECARAMGLNLTVPEHQAIFEELYSFFTESLFNTVDAKLGFTAADAIVKAFPGTQVLPQGQYASGGGYAPQAPTQQPQQQGYGYRPPAVKGQSNGPFPDWALEAFAEKGVTEVYDNRHMLATSPKRPWFKSTTGGDNAPAFWPPDR
jgi:hypothetical protein